MCARTFCPTCGEEMIHRDRRRSYESASALGQIIHREGPRELTVGDLDLYCAKWLGGTLALKALEHKQPLQQLGKMQSQVFSALDAMFSHALQNPIEGLPLHSESGVFVVRGEIKGEMADNRKVNFGGPQIVSRLDGTVVCRPRNRGEFYDWLNVGPGWTPRRNQGRFGGNA